MDNSEEKRANELVAKAEATLKKWSFFSSSSKSDDAIELYVKAANNYKIAKNWQRAADCFVKVAKLSKNVGNQYDSASNYVLAAEMLKNFDSGAAIRMYLASIAILGELGKFGSAAKQAEIIAAMYEAESKLEDAIKYYKQAADYFRGDNSKARAGKCIEKIGFLSATLGKFDKAFTCFEKLGIDSLGNNMLRFNAKKHFMRACMCSMARNDIVAARNCINRYSDLDYSFRESPECKLMEGLVEAGENRNADQFADCLYSFDSLRRLDPWETSVFLQIKTQIGGGDILAHEEAGLNPDDVLR